MISKVIDYWCDWLLFLLILVLLMNSLKTNAHSVQSNNTSCPICLDEIEDPTVALECRHTFCYGCINHWIMQRNRCPMCRQVVYRLRHNVTAVDGTTTVHEEVVSEPEETQGYILNLGFITIVQTPMDSSLHAIQPVSVPGSLLHQYCVRSLNPDRAYFLAGVPVGTIYVLPDALRNVTAALESRGIYEIEAGTHDNQPSTDTGRLHSSFLGIHSLHDRRHSGTNNHNY